MKALSLIAQSGAKFRKRHGLFLLTPGNPKTEKGRGRGFWTFILHLAPADLSGFNVCPGATAGCIKACLNTAGRGAIMAGHAPLTHEDVKAGIRNAIQKARIRRTELYFADRPRFLELLEADIRAAIKMARAKRMRPVFRLNGTSDIRWELSKIISKFPRIQFYDYTKLANRRRLPANYSLVFSLAEGNDAAAAAALQNGMNVAAVFRNKETVERYIRDGFELDGRRYPVFCGDDSDLRFLDPAGHIIALYAKGNAKRDTSGFVRD